MTECLRLMTFHGIFVKKYFHQFKFSGLNLLYFFAVLIC
jgi:hypothetical protein